MAPSAYRAWYHRNAVSHLHLLHSIDHGIIYLELKMSRDFTWQVVWVEIHLKHRLDDLLCIAKHRQCQAQIHAGVLRRKLYKQQIQIRNTKRIRYLSPRSTLDWATGSAYLERHGMRHWTSCRNRVLTQALLWRAMPLDWTQR